MPRSRRKTGGADDADEEDDDDDFSAMEMGEVVAKAVATALAASQKAASDQLVAAQRAAGDQHAALFQQLLASQIAHTQAVADAAAAAAAAQAAHTQAVKDAADSRASSRRAKLPPWDPMNVSLWFDMAATQFAAEGITGDQEKYHQTLAALPPQVCATLNEFVHHPPAADKFKAFREAVISSTKPPRAERFRL